MKILSGITAFLVLAFCLPVQAQENPAAGSYCQDSDRMGWNFYCDVEREKPVEESLPEVAAPQTPEVPPPTYTEQMMAYRKELDELKHRAILEPTSENVQIYMRAQQEMVRIAGRFTEAWQRSLFSNPDLDANVKRPLTTIGSNLMQDRLKIERETAFTEAATEMGLVYVYASPTNCVVCSAQTEILQDMVSTFEIEILPVSRDGYVDPAFPSTVFDEGQLAALDLEDVPSPFLALVEPQTNFVELIGAGLMTQDIILDRVRIITKVPQGELYD